VGTPKIAHVLLVEAQRVHSQSFGLKELLGALVAFEMSGLLGHVLQFVSVEHLLSEESLATSITFRRVLGQVEFHFVLAEKVDGGELFRADLAEKGSDFRMVIFHVLCMKVFAGKRQRAVLALHAF